ncbi:hypothetical protein BDR22DRAFT_887366 [Usnea florida]
MGLGVSKKRSKLSHDPNNTAWSRSATKYGQKILQSHGWTPGDLLGATDAPYSELRSAASVSHIRIRLKDNSLGLGAKHETACDGKETTGLGVFEDLLGRLNGRSTIELEKDRVHTSNLKGSAYVDQRWGKLRFVSGGLLIGAELRDCVNGGKDTCNQSQHMQNPDPAQGTLPEANGPQEGRSELSNRRKDKNEKISGNDKSVKESSKGIDWSVVGDRSRGSPSVVSKRESHALPKDVFHQSQVDKIRTQAETMERKLKRRLKRDARQPLKVPKHSPTLPSSDLIQFSTPGIAEAAVASGPVCGTDSSTRLSQGLGTGRLGVRHRYIQHKKMCMMDNKALNEILMIKS